MSSIHLSEGSTNPEKVKGKLRLYSMKYCPFAQRALMILLVKGIPHDIVNINLLNKPNWYFKLNPKGLVPALDIGDKIICESLDIANYLDKQYPEPPLYPAEPHAREQDCQLINKIDPVIDLYYKLVYQKETKTSKEWLAEFTPHLQIFEDELSNRGSVFFGGDKPGMVDYMIWPWGERAGITALSLGEKLPVADGDFVKLRTWMKAMRKVPVVESVYHGPEKIYKINLAKRNGDINAYDSA